MALVIQSSGPLTIVGQVYQQQGRRRSVDQQEGRGRNVDQQEGRGRSVDQQKGH